MQLTLEEFRTKADQLLTKRGYVESGGHIYYPENAMMDMLEFMYDEFQKREVSVEQDIELRIAAVVERAFTKLAKP